MDIVQSHVDIVLSHVDIVQSHVDIIQSYVDIVLSHVDIVLSRVDIVLSCFDLDVIVNSVLYNHFDFFPPVTLQLSFFISVAVAVSFHMHY